MCDIEDPLGRLVGMLVGSRCLRNLERFFISGVKEADMDDDDDDDATFSHGREVRRRVGFDLDSRFILK